jgi:hypothetical protein
LADDLRDRGYDVATTQEAGHDSSSDKQQLSFASGQDRAILTFNIRDFAPLHEQWMATGRSMPALSFRSSWACGSTARSSIELSGYSKL